MVTYADRNLYRVACDSPDLISFRVTIKETDMLVMAESDLRDEAYNITLKCRLVLEEYLRSNPEWGRSLEPVEVESTAPPLVRVMSEAAMAAGVGPMAAVAGAIAEAVGKELGRISPTVIIENGGDVFLNSRRERIIGIYAGRGPGETGFGLKIDPGDTPLGICTSSGLIGPSLSRGTARVATVLSRSAPLADTVATALGNRLKSAGEVKEALGWAGSIEGVSGALALHGVTFGAWGDLNLVKLAAGD
jgi:ApbE superfamily uncharacterized protein (UPF0280 family)